MLASSYSVIRNTGRESPEQSILLMLRGAVFGNMWWEFSFV